MNIAATLCENLKNQPPKSLENSTCEILSVQLENSISPLIFTKFQQS